MIHQFRDPWRNRFRFGERGQQHPIIAPSLTFTALVQRQTVGRAAKQPRKFAAQYRAPIRATHVRHGVLAILLFHHINQHINGARGRAFQIAGEGGPAAFAGGELVGISQIATLAQK